MLRAAQGASDGLLMTAHQPGKALSKIGRWALACPVCPIRQHGGGDFLREIEAIPTPFGGINFRSRTEARWAVFFQALGLSFEYESRTVRLSDGRSYLPDFFLADLNAYLEVKAGNDDIVTEEAGKARRLAADQDEASVWLAIGMPNIEKPNILPLNEWAHDVPIDDILSTPENRYRFLADRRDEGIYWLQADFVGGGFRHSMCVGGPGEQSDHDRLPITNSRLLAAYEGANSARFDR